MESFFDSVHVQNNISRKELECFSKDDLIDLILQLIEKNSILEERLNKLENQISKNSNNSSKPPSTDGFNKKTKKVIKNNRKKTTRKSGGQNGHKGKKLNQVSTPDNTILLTIDNCKNCGENLEDIEKNKTKRQVFDIPPLTIEVTEYICESGICPCCHEHNSASFPDDVKSTTQYGKNFRSLVVYLNQYQFIPYDRVIQFFSDVFNHSFSQGTIFNILQDCHTKLENITEIIKTKLINSEYVHCDESGGYCNKLRQWFHVTSTSFLTYFAFHKSRGRKAIDDINILPNFNGKVIHDFYASYFQYNVEHILCNSHLLRELTFLHEEEKQRWAFYLKKLIYIIKEDVDITKENSQVNSLSKEKQLKYNILFQKIISIGFRNNPKKERQTKKRGRVAQSPAWNLLNRLQKWDKSYLAFMTDFSIPFDNNQAERDIRMLKLQQKISGTFRSIQGAEMFCRIRGYISTARKNNIGILQALNNAFNESAEKILMASE